MMFRRFLAPWGLAERTTNCGTTREDDVGTEPARAGQISAPSERNTPRPGLVANSATPAAVVPNATVRLWAVNALVTFSRKLSTRSCHFGTTSRYPSEKSTLL